MTSPGLLLLGLLLLGLLALSCGAPRASRVGPERGEREGAASEPQPSASSSAEPQPDGTDEADGAEDTGSEDTGSEDTGSEDTGSEDTGSEDTGDRHHADAIAPPSLEALTRRLEDTGARPWRTFEATLDACPPPRGRSEDELIQWYEECGIGETVAFDTRSTRWIVLDVDYSEGGAEAFSLYASTPARETVLMSASLDPAAVGRLRRRVRRFRVEPAPAQLIVRAALTDYSLNTYAPLVELGAPLAHERLWLETTTDLDHPEYVLHRIAPDGSQTELGRRPASLGPCDGGGYWCGSAECDDAGLRAEGRLCVQPIHIRGVSLGPDRSLVVMGAVMVAGHGGYPPFHWVLRWTP